MTTASPAKVTERLEQVVGAPLQVTELKRKEGRRRTLRVSGPRGSAIAKLYVSERAPLVARRVAALVAGPDEPEVPRVLLADPGLRLVVLSDVSGTPLRDALLGDDMAACRRAGAALAAWHGFWRGRRPDGVSPHTPDRELAILRERASVAPAALRTAVETALPSLTPAWDCSTVVHRDLYEEQLLLGDRVGLIDLDDVALGPPELDVGNLLAHVELLELRNGRDARAAVAAFIAGYGADSLDESLLDTCRRLALLRLACIHKRHELATRARAEVGARA